MVLAWLIKVYAIFPHTLTDRNDLIIEELETYSKQNPEKAEEWFQKGLEVRSMTDSHSIYTRVEAPNG